MQKFVRPASQKQLFHVSMQWSISSVPINNNYRFGPRWNSVQFCNRCKYEEAILKKNFWLFQNNYMNRFCRSSKKYDFFPQKSWIRIFWDRSNVISFCGCTVWMNFNDCVNEIWVQLFKIMRPNHRAFILGVVPYCLDPVTVGNLSWGLKVINFLLLRCRYNADKKQIDYDYEFHF